jgi:hypothetical protein
MGRAKNLLLVFRTAAGHEAERRQRIIDSHAFGWDELSDWR